MTARVATQEVARLLDERAAQGLPRDRFAPAVAETIGSILRDAEGGDRRGT